MLFAKPSSVTCTSVPSLRFAINTLLFLTKATLSAEGEKVASLCLPLEKSVSGVASSFDSVS